MRADFQRYYDVDLEEALATWSVRRIYDLVKYLPPEAALWRVQEAEPKQDDERSTRSKLAEIGLPLVEA